jgi:hypothetical protein
MAMNVCPTCGAREKRSTDQNARYWKLLHAIADGVHPIDTDTGESMTYSADIWHLFWKGKLLGCDDVKLPNGRVVVVPRSTTDLDVPAFGDYMAAIEAWAADRGVFLPDREGIV